MLARALNFGLVVVGLSLLGSANAALDGCAKTLALKVTNIYENGDSNFHYDYCENLHDGRGFTAGIAGFCSGTGDAWEVIQAYHKLTGGRGDEFSKFDTVLKKYAESGSDSTSGLDGYCALWGKLGKGDARFKQAQDSVRDELYVAPAQQYSAKLGLRLTISQAQLYDTGIEHGTGNDADGLGSLIKRTNAKFTSDRPGSSGSTLNINNHKVDEIVWLNEFLGVRTDDLLHPRERENQGGNYWAQTVYRVKSYQWAVNQKEYNWGNSVRVLDNDGKPTTVYCDK
ncbi:hypothetical protein GGI21_000176 [Coemansia aciculifera]|uniref:Uncharacterized protein n=1 Tax=Coemansia aciculifera TaxID=417176 RepID=A0ACC1M5V1_9FUNG|nr:hypothetical protein IWW38_001914 [Coemansia aciculifera]KAJ2911100.1 hypothetical protein GGI21_000176 [Coemansia aciculifera]